MSLLKFGIAALPMRPGPGAVLRLVMQNVIRDLARLLRSIPFCRTIKKGFPPPSAPGRRRCRRRFPREAPAIGLAAAQTALQREGLHGTALLISDLGDAPSDNPKVRRQLFRFNRAGITLKILPLPNALSIDVTWFKRLVGPEGFAQPLPAARTDRPGSARAARFPIALAAVGALLALLVAAHELTARSLRWGEAR